MIHDTTTLNRFYDAAYRIALPYLSDSPSQSSTPVRLASSGARSVLRFGDVVVKIYDESTPLQHVETSLALIGCREARDLFLQPLCRHVFQIDDRHSVTGRLLTLWPAAHTFLPASVEQFEWVESAQLLAKLHSLSIPSSRLVRPAGWLSRLGRLKSKIETSHAFPAEKKTLLAALATLPRLGSTCWHMHTTSLIHGDWHPGQVARSGHELKLIDSDDVGLGDPMWDLARVAGWSLAGVISNEVWNTFFSHYAAARLLNKQQIETVWQNLELPARAAAILSAATGMLHAEKEQRELEDYEKELLESCQRIVKLFH